MEDEAKNIDEAIEKLALAQAIYKSVEKVIDRKTPNTLGSYVDEYFRKEWRESNGRNDSPKLIVNGKKVGWYKIVVEDEKEPETVQRFEVISQRLLEEWCKNDLTDDIAKQFITETCLEQFAEWYFNETGEIPDGCTISQTVTLAQPRRIKYTQMHVDIPSLCKAMQGKLSPSVVGLLGGGSE